MFAMPSPPPCGSRGGASRAAALLVLAVGLLGCGVGEEAGPDAGPLDPLGLHDWASAVVHQSGERWVGERLADREPDARPPTAVRLESELAPIAIHAAGDVGEATVASALRGVEAMHALLLQEGWPEAIMDGGRGGTVGFDVYMVDDVMSRAGFDERSLFSYLDRGSSFARAPSWLPSADTEVCAATAYAEARLLSLDPAEAESWRRATAAYLAQRLTGRWGCEDEALENQAQPFEAYVPYADEVPTAGGALLLAALSQRHESTAGEFVASLWDLASQRTWEGTGYRGSPDLWEALETVLRVSDDPTAAAIETVALDRFLAGTRRTPSSPAWVAQLGPNAAPPALLTLSTSHLSTHPPSTGELDPPIEIEPTGTFYALVHVGEAAPQSRLRVFLRGEFGVAWSLAVARLASDGRELGRMSAPSRRGTPHSYLPVELGDDTVWVAIAVTNLGREARESRHFPVPNVDGTRSDARAARIMLELVSDEPAPAGATPEAAPPG